MSLSKSNQTTGFGVKVEDVGMQGMYRSSSVSVSSFNPQESASCLLTNEYKSA